MSASTAGPASQACPESAIFTDFKAPPDMTAFVEDNRRFFIEPLDGRDESIGSPGGSGKVGRVGADTELVRSWDAG